MAVKASITITISKYRDCDSITRYYKLQASTAAAPAIPTTLNPSGWSTAEPTYTSGSTNTLYYTDCYIFSDGTFQYTDDGNGKAVKSSSYEAAKEAYNKAQAAQDSINDLEIGGTNLLRGTNIVTALTNQGTWSNGTWRNAGTGTGTRTSISVSDAPNTNIKVGWSTTSTSGQVLISQDNVKTTSGETYTLSCYAKGTGSILLQYGNGTVGYLSSNIQITDANNWKKYVYTFTSRGTANIYLGSNAAGDNVSFCGMKLESGNKATDWSPAPEDTESKIETIKTQVNNIQIGGRNLAIKGCFSRYGTATYTTIDLTNFIKSGNVIISRTATSNEGPIIDRYTKFETGQEYVISFRLRKLEGTFSNFFIYNDVSKHTNTKVYIDGEYKDTFSKTINITDDTNWHRYELYFMGKDNSSTMNDNSTNHIIFQPMKSTATAYKLEIDGYKIEKGNKPTDWSPAPEDQVNNIQIGGTNILRGTDIVTALTNQGTWSNGTWRSATSGNGTRERIDITDSPNGNIKKGWRFTRTAESNNASTDIAQDYVPVANGQTYTMSCWARCVSGNTRLRLQYGKNPWRNNNHPNITDTNWKRYSYTFTVGEQSDGSTNGNTMVYFGLFPYSDNSAGVLEICGLKLESGNKATDWSPAPEDMKDAIKSVETELNAVQADYLKETTFTNYKSDQIKKDNTFEQRIKQTSVTIYGNDDGTIDPDAGEALVNRLNKVDNDLNGENGALDRIETAEGTLEGTGLNEYDQAIKITQRFLNVETDVDQIKNMFKITGGTNLIQNSVGYFTDRTGKPTMWNIAANTIYTPFGYDGDLVGVTISRGKLFCAKGSMTTTQNNIMTLLANKKMSISFKYKNGANATSKVKIFNGSVTFFEKTFNSTVNSWTEVIATFDCTVNSLQITIESTNTTNNNGILISDLMLNYGDVKPWELCSNEVYGAMVKLSGLGIEVTATTAHTKNFMTTDGILVYEYDSEHDIVGNLITKITDDGILTNQLESTGDIIERNLVHTMIKDSANHNVYVEYIR